MGGAFEKNTNVENLIINHLNGERVKKNFATPFLIFHLFVCMCVCVSVFLSIYFGWRFNLSVLNKLRLVVRFISYLHFILAVVASRLLRR